MEEWRDVIGYEDIYQVSSYGRVKSLDRVITRSDGHKHTVKERIKELEQRIAELEEMLDEFK